VVRSDDKSIVVAGIGNPMRGDDAVGRLVARVLIARQLPDIRIIESEGEATQLLEALAGAAGAIVIDACRSGAPVGTIHRFNASQAPLPMLTGNFSSHGFGLAAALELARTFEQLPHNCVIFAVEGEVFTHDSPLSAPVVARFDELVARVEKEIEHMILAPVVSSA
jgi:hydrogenase maturation protease